MTKDREHGEEAGSWGEQSIGASPALYEELVRAKVVSRLFGAKPRRVRVGRFDVEDEIGEGAMGIVYAARDAELDRRVAVKLIHPHVSDAEAYRERLHREAKLLARLNHPNVVTVHEVGHCGDQMFIAMELIEGVTLRQWWSAEKRSWSEVLGVFGAAGRGLAAAHAAGVVHRDFKPDNVMVGRDGVRVMDFGLARSEPTASEAANTIPDGEAIAGSALELTRSGAVVGTPRYMAPEQHDGRRADERSDQFSFCASLYEALFGVHAFAGDDLSAIAAAKARGDVRPPPPQVRVPGWVLRIVRRGLRADPAQRFPTMGALVDALEADPTASRRRIVGGSVAVGVAVGVGFGLYAWLDDPRCTGAAQELQGVWDPSRATAMAAAIAAASPELGPDTATRVQSTLDAYADAWATAHREVCEATTVRGEASLEVLDLRMACLDRHREQLSALVDGLTAGVDVDVVAQAVSAAVDLPSVQDCADVERLRGRPSAPRDPATRARYDAAVAQIGAARTAVALGRVDEALTRAHEAVDSATDFPGLAAEAHFWLAQALHDAARYDEAARTFVAAERAAVESGDDQWAARSATAAAYCFGRRLARYDAAAASVSDARSWIRRLGDPEDLRARLDDVTAVLAAERGDFEEARKHFEAALQASQPPNERATLLLDYGDWLREQGDYERAEVLLRQGFDARVQQLGESHPDVARARLMLGTLRLARGDHDGAARDFEEARAQLVAVLGEAHVHTARPLNNLAILDMRAGRVAEAAEKYERVLALLEATLGPRHPDLIGALSNLSVAARHLGDGARELQLLERALAIVYENFGEDSPRAVGPLTNLANLHMIAGRLPQAIDVGARAVRIIEASNDDHPMSAHARSAQGRALVLSGRAAEARPLLERAVAGVRPGEPPFEVALMKLGLAMALAAEPDEAERARTLATEARTAFSSLGAPVQVGWADALLARIPAEP